MLGFFKYTDFLLENFNAFAKLANLDFEIPLPHILLPIALSFVTFQQIAFLYDCYKRAKGEISENLSINFIDYALFISFFPQLIAGPIVHHREMMPQFAKLDSHLGSHSADFANFKGSQATQPSSPSKFAKNHESTAATARIVGFDSRGESKNSQNSVNLMSNSPQTINYEFLAKGLFIFSIGLFKKVFIADSFAKWADAGFALAQKGQVLNIAESWATSLSYTFQLYFDFSGYCDMAIGLGLAFGIVLPLNFNSPYKSRNIAEFWRRWHITLGRFLRECLYIPLGGNRGRGDSSLAPSLREFRKTASVICDQQTPSQFRSQPTNLAQDTKIAKARPQISLTTRILTLRNLFIVAFLSGIWHGAGWGFVIWGVLHGVAMLAHRVYSWFCQSLDDASGYFKFTQSKFYAFLSWFLTFNFISLAWIFFRAENLQGALNLLKGMFGVVWVELPEKWHLMPKTLAQIGGRNDTIFYILLAILVCVFAKNSVQLTRNFRSNALKFSLSLRIFGRRIYLKGGGVFVKFALALGLFWGSVWLLCKGALSANAYTPFIYFNF